jgi:hypothetical protein
VRWEGMDARGTKNAEDLGQFSLLSFLFSLVLIPFS